MSSLNESIEYDIPPVIPLTQMEMKEDGTSIVKRVRPLTYALMTFVKNILNEPDTINISDDEMEGEWSHSFSIDDDTEYTLYINTYEANELITLDVYVSTVDTELVDEASVNEFIVAMNLYLKIGQIQKLKNNSIRFHASIAVEGIASQEKDYSGPHLISPKLFANMFGYAVSEFPDIANAFIELQNTN
jgi:hypothetical protein